MSLDDLPTRAAGAAIVARDAGKLALEYFHRRSELAIERKGLQDLVSEADREVENLIRAVLGALFPGESMLGEEGGGGEADHLWIIDPIDGTANFLRGLPYWSVTLAYRHEGELMVGATYDPVHDELFLATKGFGCLRNARPVSAATTNRPESACIGLSYTFKHDRAHYAAIVKGIVEAGFDHRRLGSSALSLCHLADGRLDGVIIPYAHIWDVAAGILIAREAGAICSDFMPDGDITRPAGLRASTTGLQAELERIG
ncbi:MAG: inositol monophosphatase family protein [Geminicoccaceae bacterium]